MMKKNNIVNVGDKYILRTEDNKKYIIEIINISEYREPSAKYAVDICDEDGICADDVVFVGDNILSQCEKAI